MTQFVMPHKIVLRSTTSLSLSDRFATIPQTQRPQTVQQVRVRMASLNQSSAKSQREAIQMTNRSLSHMSAVSVNANKQQSELSNVKNRLGHVSAMARLGPVQGRGRPFRARGSSFRGGRGNYTKFENSQYVSPRGAYRGQSSRGFRGRGRGRGHVYNPIYPAVPVNRGRGGFVGRRFARGRGRGFFRGASRGQFPRGRGQFPRGRGRGGWFTNDVPLSREALDSQLDDYMAKTQSRLNADLDSYMSVDN